MKTHPFVTSCRKIFEAHLDDERAIGMKAYMKDQFDYLGIKKPVRAELEKPLRGVFKALPSQEWQLVVRQLWDQPFREYQYAALELMRLRAKELNESHLPLLEDMIAKKSWWDTVDFISPNLLGVLLMSQPELRPELIEKWTSTGNFWFQRACIIFQLRYGMKTDKKLLFELCSRFANEKEFFLRKAIGWSLRQYSKFDPESVRKYIARQPLSGLSLREASKYL